MALFLFIHRHKPAQPSRLALSNKILLCASRRCWLAWARWVEPERVQLVELPVKHQVPVREGPQPLCQCPCPCLCPCRCHNQCQCRIHLSKWSWSRCPVAEPTHVKTRHQRARTRNIMIRRARSTTNNDSELDYVHAKRSGVLASAMRSWDFMLVRQRSSSCCAIPSVCQCKRPIFLFSLCDSIFLLW